MPNPIIQVPKRGEVIVDSQGRATGKFAIFLESLDSTESTSTIEQAVQDAVGNISALQSIIARFNPQDNEQAVEDAQNALANLSSTMFLIYALKREVDEPTVPVRTVAEANAKDWPRGSIMQITNETGGETLAFSDGSDVRRATDLQVIST